MLTGNQIAVIQDSGGVCWRCRKVCRQPWQTQQAFIAELQWMGRRGDVQDATWHPRRYNIQAVHLNRRSDDDRRENLRPLCSSCAMSFRALTRRKPVFRGRRKYL